MTRFKVNYHWSYLIWCQYSIWTGLILKGWVFFLIVNPYMHTYKSKQNCHFIKLTNHVVLHSNQYFSLTARHSVLNDSISLRLCIKWDLLSSETKHTIQGPYTASIYKSVLHMWSIIARNSCFIFSIVKVSRKDNTNFTCGYYDLHDPRLDGRMDGIWLNVNGDALAVWNM